MELPKFRDMSKKKKACIGIAIASVSAVAILGAAAILSTGGAGTPDDAKQDDKFIMAEWELTDVASRVSASDSEIRSVVEEVLTENGFDLTSGTGLSESTISYIQIAIQERVTEALSAVNTAETLTGEEITALESAIADDVYQILIDENKVVEREGAGAAGSQSSGKESSAASSGISEQSARQISGQIASSAVSGVNKELETLKAQVDEAKSSINELSQIYNNGKGATTKDLTALQTTLDSVPKTASSIDSQSYTAIRNNINALVENVNGFMDDTEQGIADISLMLAGKVTSEQLDLLKSDYEAYVEGMQTALQDVKEEIREIEGQSDNSLADITNLIEDLQSRLSGSIETIRALDEKNLTDLKNTLVAQIKANKNLSDEQERLLAEKIGALDITSSESIEQLRDQLTTYIRDNQRLISDVISALSVDTSKNLDDMKSDLKSQIDKNTDLTEAYKSYLKGLIDQLDESTAISMDAIKAFLQGEIDDTTSKLSDTASTLEDTITSVNDRLSILETKNMEAASDLIQTIINQIIQDPSLTDAEKAALIKKLLEMDPEKAVSLEAIKEELLRIRAEIIEHLNKAIASLTVTPGADLEETKEELKDQVNQNPNLTEEEKKILIEMIERLDASVAGDIAKIKEALQGMLSDMKGRYDHAGDNVKTGDQHLQDEIDQTMQQLLALAEQTNLDIQSVLDMIGNSYTPTFLYHNGSYCVHEKKLYRCKEDLSVPEEFTVEHWEKVDLADEVDKVRSMISDEFSPQMDYEKGDSVIRDNKLYMCIVEKVDKGSDFNPSEWKETTITEVLNSNLPIVICTQGEYDGMPKHDESTLYFITN